MLTKWSKWQALANLIGTSGLLLVKYYTKLD